MRSAELAHKRHTFPLFAIGEFTSYEQAQGVARIHFLNMTVAVYPDMRTDLERLAASLPELDPGQLYSLGGWRADGSEIAPEQNPIAEFCRRWNLTLGRAPADWARQTVAHTVAAIHRTPNWAWAVSWSGSLLISQQDLSIGDGGYFDPTLSELKRSKERVSRRFRPRLTEIMRRTERYFEAVNKRAEDQAGNRKHLERHQVFRSKTDYNEHEFRWTVEHQIGRKAYKEIQSQGGPSDTYNIQRRVTGILRLIGLGWPTGRPRKPARS